MATANTDKMERFAFDVFVHTMSRLETKTDLPTPKYRENIYEHPDFLFILSRGFISYQVMRRISWKPKFEAKFYSNGLKKWDQILEFLKELLEEMDRQPRNPLGRVIASLALINDLIQFLYSKNRRLFLNNLSSSWRNYFAYFEEDFEKEGGLSYLYSICTEELQALDEIVNFILNFCIKYGEKEVSLLFTVLCDDPSLMGKITKDLKRIEKDETALISSFERKLSISSRSPERSRGKKLEASSSLKNTGLSIIPHEERLRHSYYLSADKETSAEKPIASTIIETSAAACADLKVNRKQSGQSSREDDNVCRQPCRPITSPEGRSKNRSRLTGYPLSPGESLMFLDGLTGSPLSPKELLKDRGSRAGSPLRPEGGLKDRGSPVGSPLSPGGSSKILGALTRSPLRPEIGFEDRGSPAGSPHNPARSLKVLGGLTGSPLSPEGRLKDRSSPAASPLSPEGRLEESGALAGSQSPQEQRHRRGSPQTEGISRIEQKRQKMRQWKKPEPTN